MGIYSERGLTFSRTERKTPVLRPELQSKQSSLCGLQRSRDEKEKGPNGQIVSNNGLNKYKLFDALVQCERNNAAIFTHTLALRNWKTHRK